MPTNCKCLQQLYFDLTDRAQQVKACGNCLSQELTPGGCICFAQSILLSHAVQGHACIAEGYSLMEKKQLPWKGDQKCKDYWKLHCSATLAPTEIELRTSSYFCYDRFSNLLQFVK
jgi:hypothetical protein